MWKFWKKEKKTKIDQKEDETEVLKTWREIEEERKRVNNQLEELANSLDVKAQTEEKEKMIGRFTHYLAFISFLLVVKTITKDSEERTKIVNNIISIWEEKEKAIVKKQKAILKNADLSPDYSDQIDNIIRIKESALEETKSSIRFAFKELYNDR